MDRGRGRRIVYRPIYPFIDQWGHLAYRVELSNQTLTMLVARPGDPPSPEEAIEMVKEELRDGLAEGLYLSSDFYPPDDHTQYMNMQPPIFYAPVDGHWPEEVREEASGHDFGRIPASAEAVVGLRETSVKEGECSVCLMDLDTGSKLRMMPCSHYFHGHCIFTWLQLNHVCPLCRFPLPTEKQQ